MPLREIIQKRDHISETDSQYAATGVPPASVNTVPEIRFVRSDTYSHEIINPPSYHDGQVNFQQHNDFLNPAPPSPTSPPSHRKSLNIFRRSSKIPPGAPAALAAPQPKERRLSQLLHFDRGSSRRSSALSINVPTDLPQIDDGNDNEQEREAQWEKRATMLVQSPQFRSPASPSPSYGSNLSPSGERSRSRSSSASRFNAPEEDVNIQEAIRLHESGSLEQSTEMFGRLADPNGANNALSQVLYGLALRHGWGCTKDPEQAITYLSAAASNSASIESEALRAGIKKGGSAKGELVLAIFELANCFRNGWGVAKDPAAARQYFETAANLGDTDAMNEAAWCYLEGFGGKKNKVGLSFFLHSASPST
ncbi:hypothetical protein ASPWEDRAFT_176287 [Aspergillus wentii DTO 134E9]|uniref:HCP-like protein n=1 Tax=Aspergillus wentii DTO 134E9 TaxID=1073089 RepID=A0A1L9R8D8_ASPWE|nr:uncharacterized protein ASPWEDRAFT_176287 [Aspergillus wentii DTO 134E9]KAI9925021.1 hypothetical protein MW887_006428 [Aspergillus wentii]OJJ31190.1 hypothetical protein ASPWEDRAFT_176287 [Aspergillus wentii DTO 134E9]